MLAHRGDMRARRTYLTLGVALDVSNLQRQHLVYFLFSRTPDPIRKWANKAQFLIQFNRNCTTDKIIHYVSPLVRGEFGLSSRFREDRWEVSETAAITPAIQLFWPFFGFNSKQAVRPRSINLIIPIKENSNMNGAC